MYSVFTTYNENNLPVLNVICTKNNSTSTENTRDLVEVISTAALNTVQTVFTRGSRGVANYARLIHRMITEGNDMGIDDEGRFQSLFSMKGGFDDLAFIIVHPENYQPGNVGWQDYLHTLFDNIPLFTAYLNTVETAERYLLFKALADDVGVSVSSARGGTTSQLEDVGRQTEFCIADSFAGMENISAILAGKMSNVYKDDDGNEIRIVPSNPARTVDAMVSIGKMFNERLNTQRQVVNIQSLQSDFRRISRNIARSNDRAMSIKYDEGYKAALKVVSLIGKYSNQWHVVMSDDLPFASEMGKPYVVYHGPRIECNAIMKDNIMYHMPEDMVGKFFIDSIALRVQDDLCDAMAQGWMPHRSGETEEETAESEAGRWGGLCIGDLDCASFERFVEIPEMLKTVYWHSMYPGTPSLATAMLFGFLEKNEDEGDYFNKQDGEYYSAELIEEELAVFHKYIGQGKDFETQEVFSS